jgi:hypothetical protein
MGLESWNAVVEVLPRVSRKVWVQVPMDLLGRSTVFSTACRSLVLGIGKLPGIGLRDLVPQDCGILYTHATLTSLCSSAATCLPFMTYAF